MTLALSLQTAATGLSIARHIFTIHDILSPAECIFRMLFEQNLMIALASCKFGTVWYDEYISAHKTANTPEDSWIKTFLARKKCWSKTIAVL